MSGSSRSDYPDRDPGLFLELARDRLNTQLSAIDALDGKIGLLFSLASGLLGILAAVLALRAATSALLALVPTVVAYCVVAYAGVSAYLTRTWKIGPDLGDVWNGLWKADSDALATWKVANALWSDYEANRKLVNSKTGALRVMFAGIIIQSLLLALALALVTVGV